MTDDDTIARFAKEHNWHPDFLALLVESNWCCVYCGRSFMADHHLYFAFTHDHLVPSSKDGSKDGQHNLVAACDSCNKLKGKWNPLEANPGLTTKAELLKVCREYVSARLLDREARGGKARAAAEALGVWLAP